MRVEGFFFTRVAHNFAAVLAAFSLAAGLTACGHSKDSPRVQDPYQDDLALQRAGDRRLREAIDIEPTLDAQQIQMDIPDYRRADMVFFFRERVTSTPTDVLVRWHGLVALYQADMAVAALAVDRRLIYFEGPADAVSNRAQTSTAYLREINAELALRGIR